MPDWNEQLDELQQQGLRRHLITVDGRQQGLVSLNGSWLVDFSSNDYLGLSEHEHCLEMSGRHVRKYGCGARASRVVSGGGRFYNANFSSYNTTTGDLWWDFPLWEYAAYTISSP